MGAKERAERVLRIQEGDTKPEDEFERRCLEFYNYLNKEIKDPYFYWDEWMMENFETLKTYSIERFCSSLGQFWLTPPLIPLTKWKWKTLYRRREKGETVILSSVMYTLFKRRNLDRDFLSLIK